MERFAQLYQALDSSTSTRAKLDALKAHWARAEPADAAWAVYFLSGGRPRRAVTLAEMRQWAAQAAGIAALRAGNTCAQADAAAETGRWSEAASLYEKAAQQPAAMEDAAEPRADGENGSSRGSAGPGPAWAGPRS